MEEVLPNAINTLVRNIFQTVYNTSPFAQRTLILVPNVLREAVSVISNATGFDEKTIAFTSGMFLCYPLALIMHRAPYGRWKHLASFLLGAFLLQFTIGQEWLHMLFTSTFSYILFLTLSARSAKNVVPIFLLTYLSLSHIHRMYSSYNKWSLNFVTPQMIATIKIYSLAYNLYDGVVLRESSLRGNVPRGTKRCARFAVYELPNLVEYYGYVFCFSTILSGPPIEYMAYADACSGRLLYTSDGKLKGELPSRLWPTLQPFFVSILCMSLYIFGAKNVPFFDPNRPGINTPFILTPAFLLHPWYHRLAYSYVAAFFLRMRYFFPWKSAEGSTNLWYGGFEGFDEEGNPKGFEHSSNLDLLAFELTEAKFQNITRCLNKKTAMWLSRYVYGRTNGSLVATYFVSAFWHGFYPGYYLYFLSSPLLMICERIGQQNILPRMDNPWKLRVWNWFHFIWVRLILAYIAGPFFLLNFHWSLLWWRSFYFYGHIACILFYGAVSLLPTPKSKME